MNVKLVTPEREFKYITIEVTIETQKEFNQL